jgi:uncharacterized membrane protein
VAWRRFLAPRGAEGGRAKRTLALASEVVARWIAHEPAWRRASSVEISLREIRKIKEKREQKSKTKRLKKKVVLVVGDKDKRT